MRHHQSLSVAPQRIKKWGRSLTSITLHDRLLSVAGNAQYLTSQTGSSIEYNFTVLLCNLNLMKNIISLVSFNMI